MLLRVSSLTLALALSLPTPGFAQSIKFGDNSSEYAGDGECDDRRFVGLGMATGLDSADNYHDADDCRHAYNLGTIRLLDPAQGRAATQCSAVNFGDNTSEYAGDGECDDFRFDGPGTSSVINLEDTGHDARDCRRACDQGTIYLRNY